MPSHPSLAKIYWRLHNFLYPELKNSQHIYFATLKDSLTSETRWLDVGCGHQIVPVFTKVDEQSIVRGVRFAAGIDCDVPSLVRHVSLRHRVASDLGKLPFVNGAFSLITANMVMEHVDTPHAALREAWRVLRPGGVFLVHTPNFLNYMSLISWLLPQPVKNVIAGFLGDRKEEDIYPTRYRFNTPSTIRQEAVNSGFEIIDLRLVNTSPLTKSLGPLAIFELMLLRLLTIHPLRKLQCDMIVTLRKPPQSNK